MSISSVGGADPTISLMANMAKDSQETNRGNRLLKQMYGDKKINSLQANIDQLNIQKEQTQKAAKKSFWGSLISTIIKAVTTVLSIIFPVVAPVMQAISAVADKAINMIMGKLTNNNNNKAQEAGIAAQEANKQAELLGKKESSQEDNIASEKQSLKNTYAHLENAVVHYQQAQNVAIKA